MEDHNVNIINFAKVDRGGEGGGHGPKSFMKTHSWLSLCRIELNGNERVCLVIVFILHFTQNG